MIVSIVDKLAKGDLKKEVADEKRSEENEQLFCMMHFKYKT